jgi:hypothetical protein
MQGATTAFPQMVKITAGVSMSLVCQWACTAPSLASWHEHNQGSEAVVSEELDAGRVPLPGYGVSTVEGLDATSRGALLLTALAGRCEQWPLLEATTIVVQGPIDINVLVPLVAIGLAVVDQGWVHVPRDDVRRAVTARALPSQLQQALAARLDFSAGDRAARLVEPAATAFALGSTSEAQQLLEAAEDAGMDAASTRLSEVARATCTIGEIPRSVDGGLLGIRHAARMRCGTGHLLRAHRDGRLIGRAPDFSRSGTLPGCPAPRRSLWRPCTMATSRRGTSENDESWAAGWRDFSAGQGTRHQRVDTPVASGGRKSSV